MQTNCTLNKHIYNTHVVVHEYRDAPWPIELDRVAICSTHTLAMLASVFGQLMSSHQQMSCVEWKVFVEIVPKQDQNNVVAAMVRHKQTHTHTN